MQLEAVASLTHDMQLEDDYNRSSILYMQDKSSWRRLIHKNVP